MITLGLLCVFITIVGGVMVLMALGARGIAEERRKEADRVEAEKDEK
ncbi:MAG TPA: hypothetical protein PLK30_25625 [Blastocatellia bacterium]|nr:hypothetical protein [Blastocatellia bacterium]